MRYLSKAFFSYLLVNKYQSYRKNIKMYFSNQTNIFTNLEKICQTKCNAHDKFKAEQICFHPLCISNSTCFLCELCFQTHHYNHKAQGLLKPIEQVFSTKVLNKVVEHQKNLSKMTKGETLQNNLDHVDKVFKNLKSSIIEMIDHHSNQVKDSLKEKYQIINNPNETIVISEYEKMLNQSFSGIKPPEINSILARYVDLYDKLNTIRCSQIGSANNVEKFSDMNPEIQSKAEEIKKSFANIFERKLKPLIHLDAKKTQKSAVKRQRKTPKKVEVAEINKVEKKNPFVDSIKRVVRRPEKVNLEDVEGYNVHRKRYDLNDL